MASPGLAVGFTVTRGNIGTSQWGFQCFLCLAGFVRVVLQEDHPSLLSWGCKRGHSIQTAPQHYLSVVSSSNSMLLHSDGKSVPLIWVPLSFFLSF